MKRKTQKHHQQAEETEVTQAVAEQEAENNEDQDVWLDELRNALSPHWSSRVQYQTHKHKGSDQ